MLDIKKVLTLPTPDAGTGLYPRDTMYFLYHPGDGTFDTYITNAAGTELARAPTRTDIYDGIIIWSDTTPAVNIPQRFWWDTTNLVLYVKYTTELATSWVEAIPTYAVLEFDGSGSANTMARSDHDHDGTYVKIGIREW